MKATSYVFSPDVEAEINFRIENSIGEYPEDTLTRADVIREMTDRCEDREDIYYDFRAELREFQVRVGIVKKLDIAGAKECASMGGASVAKQTCFRLRGVAYEFASWEALE